MTCENEASTGAYEGKERTGDKAVTHLTSKWNTHCREDIHRTKLNTASIDKPFLLRLGNHTVTMVKDSDTLSVCQSTGPEMGVSLTADGRP